MDEKRITGIDAIPKWADEFYKSQVYDSSENLITSCSKELTLLRKLYAQYLSLKSIPNDKQYKTNRDRKLSLYNINETLAELDLIYKNKEEKE
jgi:hypothetical protein